MTGFIYFACFIGGTIFGGILVNYFQKKQLQQLAEMLREKPKRDPADWWKDGDEDEPYERT